MTSKGIIIGLDHNLEWLLYWWWENYKKFNDLPIAIFDFGMSASGIEMANAIGNIFSIPKELVAEENSKEISLADKKKWEIIFDKKNFWISRPSWFKKPIAAMLSPFEKTIWIDLDCEIHSNIEHMFEFIQNHPLALVRESIESNFLDHIMGCSYVDEVVYNSGVIVFYPKSDVIRKWYQLTFDQSFAFSGDQHVLSRVIYENRYPVMEMEYIYNLQGINPEITPIITHYSGADGKKELFKRFKNLKSIAQKMPS